MDILIHLFEPGIILKGTRKRCPTELFAHRVGPPETGIGSQSGVRAHGYPLVEMPRDVHRLLPGS